MRKNKGDLFEKPINTWDNEDYHLFFALSESIQKQLPGHTTAGSAKNFVLKNFRDFQISRDNAILALGAMQNLGVNAGNLITLAGDIGLLTNLLKREYPDLKDTSLNFTNNIISLDEIIRYVRDIIFKILNQQQNILLNSNNNIINNNNTLNNSVPLDNLHQKHGVITLPNLNSLTNSTRVTHAKTSI